MHTYSRKKDAKKSTKPVIFSIFLSFIPSASGYSIAYSLHARSLGSVQHLWAPENSWDGSLSSFFWLYLLLRFDSIWMATIVLAGCATDSRSPGCSMSVSSDTGQGNVCSLFFTLLPRHVQESQLIFFIFPIPISCTDYQAKSEWPPCLKPIHGSPLFGLG